jgi:hypothetical protein
MPMPIPSPPAALDRWSLVVGPWSNWLVHGVKPTKKQKKIAT